MKECTWIAMAESALKIFTKRLCLFTCAIHMHPCARIAARAAAPKVVAAKLKH